MFRPFLAQTVQMSLCMTCHVPVPTLYQAQHEEWHSNISSVAIETTKRVDALELAGNTGGTRTPLSTIINTPSGTVTIPPS